MNSSVFVDQARSHLKDLLRDEVRGWGDNENALRRIAIREGMSFSTLWRLCYKPPKSVCASIFYKLSVAREALREKQLQKFREDREGIEGNTWISQAFIRAADAAAGADDGCEAEEG